MMISSGASANQEVEALSPQWLINKVNAFSEKIFSLGLGLLRSEQRLNLAAALFFLSTSVALYFQLDLLTNLSDSDHYFAYTARWIPIIFATCTVASLLHLLRVEFTDRVYLLLCLVTLSAKGFWFFKHEAVAVFVLDTLLYLACFGLLGVMHVYEKKSGRAPSFSFLVSGFLGLLAIRWAIEHFTPTSANLHLSRNLFVTERMILPLAVFWSEGTRLFKPVAYFSSERLKQILLPFNLIFPLPLEKKYLVPATGERLKSIRLQGIFDFATAGLLLALYFGFRRLETESLELNSIWLKLSALGFVYYIELFLKSSWLFRLITGFGRTLGFDLYDSFNFALLATSPFERWTRWAIYYNKWLREFICFPLMARTRQIFIPLVVTFFVSFWLHAFTQFLRLGSEFLYPMNLFYFRSKLVYYVLQMIVLYGSVKLMKFWPQGRSRTGWWGVAATCALMAAIHVCVYVTL